MDLSNADLGGGMGRSTGHRAPPVLSLPRGPAALGAHPALGTASTQALSASQLSLDALTPTKSKPNTETKYWSPGEALRSHVLFLAADRQCSGQTDTNGPGMSWGDSGTGLNCISGDGPFLPVLFQQILYYNNPIFVNNRKLPWNEADEEKLYNCGTQTDAQPLPQQSHSRSVSPCANVVTWEAVQMMIKVCIYGGNWGKAPWLSPGIPTPGLLLALLFAKPQQLRGRICWCYRKQIHAEQSMGNNGYQLPSLKCRLDQVL